MLRHIAWFNEAPVEPAADGSLTSPDGAVRRRCLIPACEMEKLGVECSVFGNLRDADPTHVGRHLQKLDSDVVVIGAMSGPSLLKLAQAAKHLGCYVIADGGAGAAIGADFIKLAEIADQIVAATEEAAAAIMDAAETPALVIPDCDGAHPADAVAKAWLDCFRQLKLKPPACANSNTPMARQN